MFSTARNTQRDSQNWIKNRRRRKEIEVSRRKGGIQRRERSRHYSVPYVFSTAQNTQRDSPSWVEKKRGRREIEVTWWKKRRVKRGREQSGQ